MITAALTARYGEPDLQLGPLSLWVHGRREPSKHRDGNTLNVSYC